MTGYDYNAGMSNNALIAYGEGKKPLSKITAQDLKVAGWKGTKKDAMHLAKTEFWKACEWHHSGGTWYNEVCFYDPADLVELWEVTDEQGRLNALKEPSGRWPWLEEEEKKVRGEYPVWDRSRKRPKILGYKNFTGTLKGDWIFLDGGGKKKASGRWINWSEVT